MACIEKRTGFRHVQTSFFDPPDAVWVSYELYLAVHNEVRQRIGKIIRKISKENLFLAIQALGPDARDVEIEADTQKIIFRLSIAQVLSEENQVIVNLFVPLRGKNYLIRKVLQGLGFGEEFLNGGSLKMRVRIEGEIKKTDIDYERIRGSKQFYFLK